MIMEDKAPGTDSTVTPTEEKSPDTYDKWLWIDPFTQVDKLKERLLSGAVLLAEDILPYVNEYNLLVDKESFSKGNLKGASYTMTPHPNDAWMFDENGQQVRLTISEDSNGPHYVVPKHSLVFIKLNQRLRIPYYVIGRHNLKISYVYQGLLLGTGPQVDPGYVGNLIIPLHNLTTEVVKIHINESFVSIDFVRTTPMALGNNPPKTLKDLYVQHGEDKCLLDLSKVTNRVNLSDYLGHATPQSAMREFLQNYKSTKVELERTKEILDKALKDLNQQQTQYEKGLKDGITQQLSKLEQAQKEAKIELKSSQTALETELAQTLEKAEVRHRIELLVVVGLFVAIVLAFVATSISTVSWARDYFGALDERLFSFEKRITITDIDVRKAPQVMRDQISNSVTAVVNSQT